MTSCVITIGTYQAESHDYLCFVPLFHYHNQGYHIVLKVLIKCWNWWNTH